VPVAQIARNNVVDLPRPKGKSTAKTANEPSREQFNRRKVSQPRTPTITGSLDYSGPQVKRIQTEGHDRGETEVTGP